MCCGNKKKQIGEKPEPPSQIPSSGIGASQQPSAGMGQSSVGQVNSSNAINVSSLSRSKLIDKKL